MIAFLFPGQGVQYPGMMLDIAGRYSCSRAVFDAASDACGRNILSICAGKDADKLDLTENTQPCLAASELAALRALESHGVHADYYAGFSLGEWTATAATGMLSEADIFSIISRRAVFMQEAVPLGEGGMGTALGCDADLVDELCKSVGGVWAASYSCPGQTLISGRLAGIDAIAKLSTEKGFKFIKLPVSVPSHCPLMEPAAKRLDEKLNACSLSRPARPLAMVADGLLCSEPEQIKQNLLIQLVRPMFFEKCVRTLLGAGVDTFIEIGPGKTLSGFINRIEPAALTLQVGDLPSLDATLS